MKGKHRFFVMQYLASLLLVAALALPVVYDGPVQLPSDRPPTMASGQDGQTGR